MSASRFVPLVVRANLRTPISLSDPIPFEGVLYDARFRSDPTMFGTPLDCIAYEDGIPKASTGVLVGGGIAGVRTISTKVVRSIDFKTSDVFKIAYEGQPADLRRLKPMSPYRQRIREYPVIEGADAVVFQVLGDPDRIERLLELVPSLGKLRRRGYGEIDGPWTVSEIDAEPEDCGWFSGGTLLRRLPVATVEARLGRVPEDVSVEMGILEPPYWSEMERIRIATPVLRAMTMSGQDVRGAMG